MIPFWVFDDNNKNIMKKILFWRVLGKWTLAKGASIFDHMLVINLLARISLPIFILQNNLESMSSCLVFILLTIESTYYQSKWSHGNVKSSTPKWEIRSAYSKETRKIWNKLKDKTKTKGSKAWNPRTFLQNRSGIRCSWRVSIPCLAHRKYFLLSVVSLGLLWWKRKPHRNKLVLD